MQILSQEIWVGSQNTLFLTSLANDAGGQRVTCGVAEAHVPWARVWSPAPALALALPRSAQG